MEGIKEGRGKEGEKKVAFPNFEPQTPDCNDLVVVFSINVYAFFPQLVSESTGHTLSNQTLIISSIDSCESYIYCRWRNPPGYLCVHLCPLPDNHKTDQDSGKLHLLGTLTQNMELGIRMESKSHKYFASCRNTFLDICLVNHVFVQHCAK